jgi:hypothetical protein
MQYFFLAHSKDERIAEISIWPSVQKAIILHQTGAVQVKMHAAVFAESVQGRQLIVNADGTRIAVMRRERRSEKRRWRHRGGE